ncbi:MAG: RNA polymerase sigma factor [Actinomycetota bacterium]
MSNLEELALDAGRGDRDAFERLVQRAQAPVWRYAYHLTRSRELADEAAQETWVRAIRALPRFRGDSAVVTWLLTIVRRVVADLLEGMKREKPYAAPPPPQPGTGFVDVQIALESLPRPLRETLVLTQVLGMTYAETAAITGTRIGTVRSRVFRARSALVEALAESRGTGIAGEGVPGDDERS